MNGVVQPTPGAVMRAPRNVEIAITAQCNLRCRYCYFFGNTDLKYQDLPTEEWVPFFDELGSLGVMGVTLAGGEPFLRPDLRELISAIVRNRMRFKLLSNGMPIDDGIAAFIAATKRCDHVQVSLDGSRPETHDSCRGAGSFDGAVRGIRTLQRHHVDVAVRVTVHRHNYRDLDAIARLLLEEIGLKEFSTNSAGCLGACRLDPEEVLLTTPERQTAMDTLLRLSRKYDGRIAAAAGPLAEGRMWRGMEEARRGDAPAFPRGGRLTACGCTWNKIAVRSDGSFIPCAMLPHLELGRVNRDSLSDVWRESDTLQALRAREAISLASFSFCTGCVYQPYCTGNCPALAHILVGRIDHPNPDACLRRFLADGGSVPA
jgi:SynChlorMet cassette radical SAM/SPASM protein ScmE